MQIIGLSSCLLVITLFVFAKNYFSDQKVEYFYFKLMALPIAIAALCGLLAYIPLTSRWPLYIGFGGIAGDVMKRFFSIRASDYLMIISYMGLFALSFGFVIGARLSIMANLLAVPFNKISQLMELLKTERNQDREVIIDEFDDADELEDADILKKEMPKSVSEKQDNSKSNLAQTIKKFEVIKPKKPMPATSTLNKSKKPKGDFILPSYDLLVKADHNKKSSISQHHLENTAKLLKKVLGDFGIEGNIIKGSVIITMTIT